MENLIIKYRGWVLTFFAAVFFSILISPTRVREISNDRLQKLVEDREVASITIVKSNAGIREKYIAQIILTPAATEKYSQLTAGISLSGKDSHFVCSIGNSWEDVDRWKDNLLKEGR